MVMNKTDAAIILARHILEEAREQGIEQIRDDWAKAVIAETSTEAMKWTRWYNAHQAAAAGPAFSEVKRAALRMIRREQGNSA